MRSGGPSWIYADYESCGLGQQWVARLTHNVELVGSSPIKALRCFPAQ